MKLRAAVAAAMEVRDAQHAAASWVLRFAGSGYGPHGGAKLVVGSAGPILVESAALALREAGVEAEALRPYVELARSVQSHAGDQSTLAVLLAAHLVRSALDRPDVGAPAFLDGYAVAARQARAVLASLAEPRPDAECLGLVAGGGWAVPLASGLRERAQAGGRRLDLATVDLRAEGGEAAWLDGAVAEPQWEPPGEPRRTGVLLLAAGWKVGPRTEGVTYRLRGTGAGAAQAAEGERRRGALDRLAGLGVGLVVAAGAVDEELCGRLQSQGAAVWTDAPGDALRRLARLTGAQPVPRLEDATSGDIGQGRLERRRRPLGGWLVGGAGEGATFTIPAAGPTLQAARLAAGEALLRAAGLHLSDPRAVPGGGRWQRDVAASLRRAADAAPGRTPYAWRAAAQALDHAADLLVANAGHDPADEPLLPDAPACWDSHPSVRLAVTCAFEAARAALRIDEVHRKRASSGAALRGGAEPTRIRGGDVPPLM